MRQPACVLGGDGRPVHDSLADAAKRLDAAHPAPPDHDQRGLTGTSRLADPLGDVTGVVDHRR